MTLGERIKYIRNDLGMSQELFGSSLKVSRDIVNNYEHDRVKNISESFLLFMCKIHRINYFWLTDGLGEPYIGIPDVILDDVIEEYQLDDTDKRLIEEYVKLDPDVRIMIKKYLENVFKNAPS